AVVVAASQDRFHHPPAALVAVQEDVDVGLHHLDPLDQLRRADALAQLLRDAVGRLPEDPRQLEAGESVVSQPPAGRDLDHLPHVKALDSQRGESLFYLGCHVVEKDVCHVDEPPFLQKKRPPPGAGARADGSQPATHACRSAGHRAIELRPQPSPQTRTTPPPAPRTILSTCRMWMMMRTPVAKSSPTCCGTTPKRLAASALRAWGRSTCSSRERKRTKAPLHSRSTLASLPSLCSRSVRNSGQASCTRHPPLYTHMATPPPIPKPTGAKACGWCETRRSRRPEPARPGPKPRRGRALPAPQAGPAARW